MGGYAIHHAAPVHHAVHHAPVHHAVHHAPVHHAVHHAPAYAPVYHAPVYHKPQPHYGYEQPKHNCSVLDVVESAEVCTPALETVCNPIELAIKVIVDVEQ